MKRTRFNIARKIAKTTSLTQSQASDLVDQMLTEMQRALLAREEVRFVNFGVLYVKETGRTTARNVRTGAPMSIAAPTKVVFRSSHQLRRSVNAPLSRSMLSKADPA